MNFQQKKCIFRCKIYQSDISAIFNVAGLALFNVCCVCEMFVVLLMHALVACGLYFSVETS